MNCQRCGTVNEPGSSICKGCGCDLTQFSAVQKDENSSSLNQTQVPENSNVINENYNRINDTSYTNLNSNFQQIQSQDNNLSNNYNMAGNSKKNNKILTIIGIIAVAVAILAVLYFTASNVLFKDKAGEDFKYNDLYFDRNQPIAVKKDGKYGFVLTDGTILVEPKYDNAFAFCGDYGVVGDVLGGSVIDRKGKEVLSLDSLDYGDSYSCLDNYKLINGTLYDNSLNKLTSEKVNVEDYEGGIFFTYTDKSANEYGIVDSKGKIIFKSKDEFSIDPDGIVYPDDFSDDYYAILRFSKKFLLISLQSGKTIYEVSKDDGEIEPDEGHIFIITDENDNETYIYLKDDNIAYSNNECEYIEYNYDDHKYLSIEYSGYEREAEYYNTETKKITTEAPESTRKSYNSIEFEKITSYTQAYCDKGYGIMEKDKTIIPCGYSSINYLDNYTYKYIKDKTNRELVVLREKLTNSDAKYTLYDLNSKKQLYTFDTNDVTLPWGSPFLKARYDMDYPKPDKFIVYNMMNDKNLTIDEKISKIEFYQNYFIVVNGNVIKYYNSDLKLIYTGSN